MSLYIQHSLLFVPLLDLVTPFLPPPPPKFQTPHHLSPLVFRRALLQSLGLETLQCSRVPSLLPRSSQPRNLRQSMHCQSQNPILVSLHRPVLLISSLLFCFPFLSRAMM